VRAHADFQQLMQDVLDRDREGRRRGERRVAEGSERPVRKLRRRGIAKLGENMAVPRFVRYAGQGYVGQYIHLGGKIGVHGRVRRRDAASRGATSSRRSSRRSRCRSRGEPELRVARGGPADVLDKEKAIYRAQMENSGKPANVHRQDRRWQAREASTARSCSRPASIRDPEDDGQRTSRAQQGARRVVSSPLRAPQGGRLA
jgi:elongation factor Ts